METKIFNTEKDLKTFVSNKRKDIKNINGVKFEEMYPILEVTNKHASYYDVESQGNKFLTAPFSVHYNKD